MLDIRKMNLTAVAAILFCLSIHRVGSQSQLSHKYRICVLKKFEAGEHGPVHCSILSSHDDSQVECVYGVDRLDCLQKVVENLADFSVFKSEDLLLTPSFEQTKNLLVTNELRLISNQSYEFDMVVLVTNAAEISSLSDLKGKRLCHPGFDEDGYLDDWSEVFSQYFEEVVVPQLCDPKLSIPENRIKSSSMFFNDSCKPGAWSPDSHTDYHWKHTYGGLCKNCHNSETCDHQDLYWGRLGPLNCLSDCQGDIAWVRLQDISSYFEVQGERCNELSNLSFLCQDGSKQPVQFNDPCVWISRPWPVIVSHKNVSDDISSIIEFINQSKETFQPDTWEGSLRTLIGYSFQPIYGINPLLEPSVYLEKGFMNANNISKCKKTADTRRINICVKNEDELEKCHVMSFVAATFDINPHFGCILSQDCIQDIIENNIDVVIVNTEDLMSVRRTKVLKPILYESADAYWRHSSAVVRADSNIHTLEDLKGKKACFVSADGLGWNSFILALKNNSLIPENTCPYNFTVRHFFSNVCVIDDSKSNFVQTCFPDELPDEYKFQNTLGWNETLALRCIVDGGGDVAFIDYNFIDKYLSKQQNEEWNTKLNSSDFRQICLHDNLKPQDCYLTWSALGQVMVNKNISVSREEEMTSAFLLLSLLFGDKNNAEPNQLNRLEQIFKLFSPFNNKENILFQDETREFLTIDEFETRTQRKSSNFESNIEQIEECHVNVMVFHNSSSSVISFSAACALLSIIISYFSIL